MTSSMSRAAGGATVLRARRERRARRLLAHRSMSKALVSAAGLVGRPVRDTDGDSVGRVVDLVARWDGLAYPPITGLVVRVGFRRAYVPVQHVAALAHDQVRLATATMDLRDFRRREGEVLLVRDVVDHQLVEVDGVRVIRASDLYVAELAGQYRLVGVDVGLGTLVRRLGPARWRSVPTPERVIDWGAVQPFGQPGRPLQLRRPNQALRAMRQRTWPTCSKSSAAPSARSCWPTWTQPRPRKRWRRWNPSRSSSCCASPPLSRRPPCWP